MKITTLAARCVLLLLALASASASGAENWVGLGNSEQYIDTGSAERKGDIATILVRENTSRPLRLAFDCKRQLILGWEGEPRAKEPITRPVKPDTHAFKAFNAACKRWYEVWR